MHFWRNTLLCTLSFYFYWSDIALEEPSGIAVKAPCLISRKCKSEVSSECWWLFPVSLDKERLSGHLDCEDVSSQTQCHAYNLVMSLALKVSLNQWRSHEEEWICWAHSSFCLRCWSCPGVLLATAGSATFGSGSGFPTFGKIRTWNQRFWS